MATNYPKTFVDVYSVSIGSVNIAGVKRISINRQRDVVRAKNNNCLRPIATHTVAINDTISIESEDGQGLADAMSLTGSQTLTFGWTGAQQSLENNNGAVTDKTVTVVGVIIDNDDINAPSKAIGEGRITGFVIDPGDGSDPVSISDVTSNLTSSSSSSAS